MNFIRATRFARKSKRIVAFGKCRCSCLFCKDKKRCALGYLTYVQNHELYNWTSDVYLNYVKKL